MMTSKGERPRLKYAEVDISNRRRGPNHPRWKPSKHMKEKTEVIDDRKNCTSASSAQEDLLCPGRHIAQQGLPDVPGPYAETGNKIHEALAIRDPSGLSLEERETYDRCLDIEARKLAELFGADAVSAKRWSENPKDPAASRIWVRFMAPNGNAKGLQLEHSCRPDCFWRVGSQALILEFKSLYGDIPVSARNLQLRDQQVMIRGNFLVPGDIGVVVVQPLVTMNPEICVYSPEDSERARLEMFARIVASNDPRSLRVPGETQCKFCKAKARCVEYNRFASAIMPGMMAALDVPVANWSPEQRSIFLDRFGVAQKWLDDCKDAMKAGFESDPNFVPGWTLAPGSVVETIIDAQQCFERFAALGGTVEAFMATVKVGKVKLKEAVNAATGRRGKELDLTIKAMCEGITEVNQKSGSLKRLGGNP
jgi:Protein of unknown function (DUF2800)